MLEMRSRRKRNLDRLIRGLQRRGWKVERLSVKMNGNPANLANGSIEMSGSSEKNIFDRRCKCGHWGLSHFREGSKGACTLCNCPRYIIAYEQSTGEQVETGQPGAATE